MHLHALHKEAQRSANYDYDQYVNSLLDPNEDTTKKNVFSFIIAKGKDSFRVGQLRSGGQINTTPAAQAEMLSLPQFSQGKTDSMQDKGPSPHPEIPPIRITVNCLYKQLAGLNVKKATVPDNISARVMSECAEQLAPVLSFIYQQSLVSGDVPLDCRKAHVVPIFKKRDHSKPENYRLVSLTSISCNIFEHILVSNVMNPYGYKQPFPRLPVWLSA